MDSSLTASNTSATPVGVFQAEAASLHTGSLSTDTNFLAIKNSNGGFNGGGYADFGDGVASGESITWTIAAGEAGEFDLLLRYSLAAGSRPLNLSVNGGEPISLPFSATGGFNAWQVLKQRATLTAGENTITLTSAGSAGPNIDQLEIVAPDPAGQPGNGDAFSTKINFQPASSSVPGGYLADTGQAYSDAVGFGWITEASLADGQPGTVPDAIAPYTAALDDRMTPGVDPRLTSYAHFAIPDAPSTSAQRWAWEHKLENGWYAVTVAVGDTGGANDSVNVLNIEGKPFMAPWTPTASFKTNLVTGVVEVTDGRLTLDSVGGTNTEIQYIEIEALPDITPDDGRPALADYSVLSGGTATAAGQAAQPLDRATNVNPAASLAVDVTIVRSGAGVDDGSFNPQTVKLYETLSGQAVAGQANTTGGGDAIVFTQSVPLKENTSYTFHVDGVTDVAGVEFLPYSATFTTGTNQASGPQTVAFAATQQQVSAGYFSSLVVSPDGMHLYAASLGGTIFR